MSWANQPTTGQTSYLRIQLDIQWAFSVKWSQRGKTEWKWKAIGEVTGSGDSWSDRGSTSRYSRQYSVKESRYLTRYPRFTPYSAQLDDQISSGRASPRANASRRGSLLRVVLSPSGASGAALAPTVPVHVPALLAAPTEEIASASWQHPGTTIPKLESRAVLCTPSFDIVKQYYRP
ncbi:uncharacterized protein N7473_007438 [Penicillium subrubescens]|uniref:uncharacterized protein n=1 Tax=Penicillium subrubescens TaxID=1316194 RepID=UPI0025451C5E|nr:uncharacterized protein N7473_007438 [Penicillium subrubescens]KAJ5891210.1 hypothetical protein N7473_007438 [Penicillium subrubescens]